VAENIVIYQISFGISSWHFIVLQILMVSKLPSRLQAFTISRIMIRNAIRSFSLRQLSKHKQLKPLQQPLLPTTFHPRSPPLVRPRCIESLSDTLASYSHSTSSSWGMIPNRNFSTGGPVQSKGSEGENNQHEGSTCKPRWFLYAELAWCLMMAWIIFPRWWGGPHVQVENCHCMRCRCYKCGSHLEDGKPLNKTGKDREEEKREKFGEIGSEV
jgi:hypothetical protein